MNKDQVKGVGKSVAAKAQEPVGRQMGKTTLELKGRHPQTDGHVQKTVGDVKEVLKDLRHK